MNIVRHILGYIIGITIFVILAPYGLIKLSLNDPLFRTDISDNILLRLIIILPLFILGIIFAIWSNIALLKIGKVGPADGFNIAISPRTKRLVTIGPYRYCRNPMMFGAFCVYFAISIFMLSPTSFITLIFLLVMARFYLKAIEEKRLLQDFGDEYINYKNKVPMIFPIKIGKIT